MAISSLGLLNSLKNCLHAPQGLRYWLLMDPEIAILVIFLFPSLIAFTTAVRSAHIPSPYDAFSTLQPEYMVPSSHRNAAPTLKLLYGQ